MWLVPHAPFGGPQPAFSAFRKIGHVVVEDMPSQRLPDSRYRAQLRKATRWQGTCYSRCNKFQALYASPGIAGATGRLVASFFSHWNTRASAGKPWYSCPALPFLCPVVELPAAPRRF